MTCECGCNTTEASQKANVERSPVPVAVDGCGCDSACGCGSTMDTEERDDKRAPRGGDRDTA